MRRLLDAGYRRMMAANEANWDARTPVHVDSEFYGIKGIKDPFCWFADFEWRDLGELADRNVLHLQCHLGTETLAFARKGAHTVGLDFSAEAIACAGRLAKRCGLTVEYLRGNVYDAEDLLGARRFDLVYTGKGSLCYLPDLDRWAETVAALLRPGGRLYLVEFHPLLHALGLSGGRSEPASTLTLCDDYLEGRGPWRHESDRTYTDGPPVNGATVSYVWAHGLGEVVNAVINAGLRIESFREADQVHVRRWADMNRTGDGWWRLPEHLPRVALVYALRAVKMPV